MNEYKSTLTDEELSDPEYMRAYVESMHETIRDLLPQWLPIETAPKNEWVLVYYTNGMEVSIATDDRGDGLWFDWDGDLYGEVSHWMPLPAAPLTNTGEQG